MLEDGCNVATRLDKSCCPPPHLCVFLSVYCCDCQGSPPDYLIGVVQSRRLLAYPYQRGFAQRRQMLQETTGESEGGGSGMSAGCFPDIYDSQDFKNWLDGSYIGMCVLSAVRPCSPCVTWMLPSADVCGFIF